MPSISWIVFGLSVEDWTLALLTTVVAYFVIAGTIRFVVKRLARMAEKTSTKLDDAAVEMLRHTNKLIILLIAFLIAFTLLDIPPKWETRLQQGWIVALGIQIALWLNIGITHWMRTSADHVTTATIIFLMRFVVWLTILLTILANVGVNITAFVTSLGIGGIAVALAMQNILGDLFASLSIALDKPFEMGDFIVVGDMLGTVENIGVKTTRIRSLSGEQIVSSNTELLKRTIHNFKRMAERRALFVFKVKYGTSVEQAAALPQHLKDIITKIPGTRFDRAHLKQLGDNALEFEVAYFVLNPDYNSYMDIQQSINLELMQICAKQGIAFANPN